MGDRSNIAVENFDGSRVYLYAHWGGEPIIKSAIHGLKSGRADDPAYLARIIFEHMIRKDPGSVTGFGISAGIEDNEHPILVISNASNNVQVWFEGESRTEPATAEVFISLVEGIDSWKERAESNELYDVLISKLGSA